MAETSLGGVIPIFFGAQPATLAPDYDFRYDSELKNHEFNAWVRSNQYMRVGVGGRYVDLREKFNITEGTASFSSVGDGFFSDTDNDLYGAQLMADFYIPLAQGLNLEMGARGGLYYNNIDVRFFTLDKNAHYEDSAVSTVLDLYIGVQMELTPSMKLRFGYQTMILGDVALAPSQSSDFDFFATSADAQLTELTVDGGYVGFELQF